MLIAIDIDSELTQQDRDKANALIDRELSSSRRDSAHPSLPPLHEANFSELIEKEIQRVSAGKPREGGIDLSRYEAPEEPPLESDSQTWQKALRSAYISNAYLSGRHINLSLLEELGKNAWLIGNSQLEEILGDLEKEAVRLQDETEQINKMRKSAQEGSRAEILGLEETWKAGIGKIIEVQVATEQLRQEVIKRGRDAHP